MNRMDGLLHCTPVTSDDGCEVDTGHGRECGEPVTAVVMGKRVCARHEDATRDIAGQVSSLLRRTP